MTPKKPVQRAIEILIRNRVSGDSLKGVFYANDFGDGAAEHHLDGHLTDSQDVTHRFSGRLSGVQFVPVEARGAPKKIARDVALHLAHQWFLGSAKREEQTKATSVAMKAVMALWAAHDFKGATEETHLRKRLQAGAKTTHGLSLLHYVCDGMETDGAMVAALQEAFDFRPGEYMGINGPGWFWRYGMEAAIQGNITAGATLTVP